MRSKALKTNALPAKEAPSRRLGAHRAPTPPRRRQPCPGAGVPAGPRRVAPALARAGKWMSRLSPDLRGARIDRAIHQTMQSEGRSVSVREVREALRRGLIKVDGRAVAPGASAAGGESVDWAAFVARAEAVLAPAVHLLDRVRVIADEPDILVLDKPADLPTHPLRPEETDTLLHAAVALRPQIASIGPPLEGGLLHRLDTGTSGVVVFAATESARATIRADFAGHRVAKTYWALAVPPAWSQRRLTGRIEGAGRRVRVQPADGAGLAAETFVRVVRRAPDRAWVVAETNTGRRHQVRAHLSEAGAPLWGDPLYGGPESSRLGLHAHSVRLSDGRTYVADLPSDLTDLLESS